MKCLCLQALTIVYGKCFEEIGPFTDTKYIVGMLDRVSTERTYVTIVKWFHHLIMKSKLLYD